MDHDDFDDDFVDDENNHNYSGYSTPDWSTPSVSFDSEESDENLSDDSYYTDTITFIKFYGFHPIFFVTTKIENGSLNKIKNGMIKTKNIAKSYDTDKYLYNNFPFDNDKIGLDIYMNNSCPINNYRDVYVFSWSLNYAPIVIESIGYHKRTFYLDWLLEYTDENSYDIANKLGLPHIPSIFEIKNIKLNNICDDVMQYEKCLHINELISITITDSHNLNYFALCEALGPYLCSSLHGIRKLMITCKSIYMYYLNYTFQQLNRKMFLKDALEHNCNYCVKLLRY